MSLNERLARLRRSVSARLANHLSDQERQRHAEHAGPKLEALEDRLLLSATLIVDAGLDINTDEGQEAIFEGTFNDTGGGGGTPGVFDIVQLSVGAEISNNIQMDIDGDRAVWAGLDASGISADIFFFDGTFDGLGAPNILNLTNTPGSGESVPQISGDHVVWSNNIYTISTGTTTTFAGAPFSFDLEGDMLAWNQQDGSFRNVYQMDLSAVTPTPTVVFPVGSGPGAQGSQENPRISGGNIIWESNGLNGLQDIFLHNLTTGNTVNISNSTTNEGNEFQIDGDIVVWSAVAPLGASGFSDIFVFDGRGWDGISTPPAVIQIGTDALDDRTPQISGTDIVWDAHGGTIFHYNVDTGITTTLISQPALNLTLPQISGSNVVWSYNNQVVHHDLNTQLQTTLFSGAGLDAQPLVSGNNVLWLGQVSRFLPGEVFFASSQSPPATHTIDWDFGDGTVITNTTLAQTHTYADNGVYSATLTITASDGRVTSDTLLATVDNIAPVVAAIDGPIEALRGSTQSFTSSFTDQGTADTHTTAWTVTDSGGGIVATGTGTELDFTTEDTGTFDVTFTVTDDDGGVGSAALATTTKTIIVGPDPLDPSQTTIQVAGSNGRDIIYVYRDYYHADALKVLVFEKDTYTLTIEDNIVGADRIITDGRGGNDVIKVLYSAGDITAELYGGDGNDWLRGGSGNDFISGGDGYDLISGGNGRDFLVGGQGGDFIIGHNDDDILVGGTYSQDRDLNATRAIQAEWNRTDISYAGRIDNLKNGTGLNGGFVLNETNVFDDGVTDILLGLRGLDWFHANDAQDYTDQRRNELFEATELEFVDSEDEYVVEEDPIV